jgi:hypothetical protein
MLAIPLGIFTIVLGAKGFTEKGIPWSKKTNITGTKAKYIGSICFVLGAIFLFLGFNAVYRIS